MIQIRTEMIWQPDEVLPYIFGELKSKIEAITPVMHIYLFGSRATVPVNEWHTLEGKDWDILVACRFRITNTTVWTKALGYHIDLTVTDVKTV